VVIDKGHDSLPIFGILSPTDNNDIAVADPVTDHGIALYPERKILTSAQEFLWNFYRLIIEDRFDGFSGCHLTSQPELHCATRFQGKRVDKTKGAVLVPFLAKNAFFAQGFDVALYRP
jgi:hypothetical protein